VCHKNAAESALEVFANARLISIHVHAQRALCIRHHSGRLSISSCRLHCDTHKFDHLYCALVTLARQRSVRGSEVLEGREDLTVESTAISGSLRAVQCRGDGELQDVRVCPQGNLTLFWFTVVMHGAASSSGASCARHANVDVTSPAWFAHWQDSGDGNEQLQRRAVLNSMQHKKRRVMAFGGPPSVRCEVDG
jgi:hypothetical protein